MVWSYKGGKYSDFVYFEDDFDSENSVDNDQDEYVPPDSQGEYYEVGGNYSEKIINDEGVIPPDVQHLVGGVQKDIVMSGSRNTDKSKFTRTKKFQFGEVHHGPIKNTTTNTPTCDLYEVQATYHHRKYHKGAVGQWNDLVKQGKLTGKVKYKK